MRNMKLKIGIFLFITEAVTGRASAQINPALGYYDIPPGFDFPADKATLEKFRKDGNISAQRRHAWNVFGGMTQPTPDGKYTIFETWYSEAETFQSGAVPQAAGPRRNIRRFAEPRQFGGQPGKPQPEAAGSALLSEVMFNFPNHKHIRAEHLYLQNRLDELQKTGAKDQEIPDDRTLPPFPPEAISLKTVWWPVAKDTVTPMPIWDPESNPTLPGGNAYPTWKRVVAVDPTRPNIPPNETMTIPFLGTPRPNSHVVGLDKFHFVVVDAQTAANVNSNDRLKQYVKSVLPDRPDSAPLRAGDYALFVGTHLTTKEIDDWVWATFWWHDRPDQGPFAADRPDTVKGVWRNYLLSATYDLNLPREQDGKPHISFNPWLEAHFRGGTVSNCMNCHHRAAFPPTNFLPIFRGDPDIKNDPAYAPGLLRTDFLWSVPFNAK